MKIPNIRSRKEQRHKEDRLLRYLSTQKKNAIADGLKLPAGVAKEVDGLMKRR